MFSDVMLGNGLGCAEGREALDWVVLLVQEGIFENIYWFERELLV